MSWVSSLAEPVPLMIGGAAMTFILAGVSFLGSNAVVVRERISRRVDVLCRGRPALAKTRRRVAVRASVRSTDALPKAQDLEVIRRLVSLNIPADRALAVYTMSRTVLSFLLALSLVFLANQYGNGAGVFRIFGGASLGGCLGWFLPSLVVHQLVLRRMRSLERGLPDAIELLVISVEAGLALEDAIDRVVPELRRSQPRMADELALTSADLKILPSRDAALRRLSARVAVPSVHSVVITLSQTMRYGTPLAQALRVVAAELRNDSLIRMEERANKMPALLTIPMVVFILPSVFLIIGGPTFLRLLDTFFH